MSLLNAIEKCRTGAQVRRYHTAPCSRTQTVGEHSCNMALMYHQICQEYGESCSPKLLLAILYHDVPEGQFGDIPSPAKRAFASEDLEIAERNWLIHLGAPTESDLSDADRWMLKALDQLEGAYTCAEQWRCGNQPMRDIGRRYVEYLAEHCKREGGQTWMKNAVDALAYDLWEELK